MTLRDLIFENYIESKIDFSDDLFDFYNNSNEKTMNIIDKTIKIICGKEFVDVIGEKIKHDVLKKSAEKELAECEN